MSMDLGEQEAKKSRKKKRRRIIVGAVAAGIVVLIIVFAGGGGESEIEFLAASRGPLVQEVSITGRVKAAESVKLAFERAGRVSRVHADVGDVVQAGEVVVSLNSAVLLAQLREAQANEATQQANLDELNRGTRPEDIAVKEAELKKAEQDLANDYDDVLDTLEDAFATADDATRVRTASVFSGTENSGYKLTFTSCSSTDETAARGGRLNAERALNAWRFELDVLGVLSSRAELEQALESGDEHLKIIRGMLEDTNAALTAGCVVNDTTLDDERAAVSVARTNVVTDLATVSALQQSIASQILTVARIENELSLKKAGATPEAVRAQEATLLSAQARVQSANAELAKVSIRAPFAGVVTEQEARVGEIVSANVALVSLISEAQFEIDASIPEVDITKVEVGDRANITLDAYGDDVVFEATVVMIDPAESIIDGVPVYDVTLQFVVDDDRIRSGMTASIDILTDRREDVIAIPSRAIVTGDDGRKFVRIVNTDEMLREVFVETGLRGSDGRTEILSGISEGDNIVTFLREE